MPTYDALIPAAVFVSITLGTWVALGLRREPAEECR